MEHDLIIISEYCRMSEVDPVFLDLLEEEGLIQIEDKEGTKYLLSSQIHEIERFSRMYYDLSINVEGISAISHLLERLKRLQKEIDYLRKHLSVYRNDREIEDY